MLHSYSNFKNDVIEIFAELINNYGLIFKALREGSYILYNAHCGLRFSYDRGDVLCDIRQKDNFEDYPFYNIYSVYEFLCPDNYKNQSVNRIYDPKLQIQEMYNIIHNHLQLILSGDFSWLADFEKEQHRRNKLIKYIFSLSHHHPLYKALNSGDKNWRVSTEKYLLENNIEIV